MTFDELQAEALKLSPKARAHLAGMLLQSLERLTEGENAQLWAEEAARRDADFGSARSAEDVFRDARASLQ